MEQCCSATQWRATMGKVKSLKEHAAKKELKEVRKAAKKFNKNLRKDTGYQPVRIDVRKGNLGPGECFVDIKVHNRVQTVEITEFRFGCIHCIVQAVEFAIQEVVMEGAVDAGEFWFSDAEPGKVMHVNGIDQKTKFDLSGSLASEVFVDVAKSTMHDLLPATADVESWDLLKAA